MMIAKAISKYNRISPKKARLLTRPLKGVTVTKAYGILANANKKASRLIYKVLKSAFDNAHQKDAALKESDVYISRITADSGPALRRHRAASMGRAMIIKKRTSHFTIHLDLKEMSKREVAKRPEEPVKRHSILKKKKDTDKKKTKKVTHSKKKR